MGLGHYYKLGMSDVVVGAMTITQYEEIAKSKARQATKSFVVVSMNFDGEDATAEGFDSREEATNRYGRISGSPGFTAYVALFDKTTDQFKENAQPLDEAFFVAQTTDTQTVTKTVVSQTQGVSKAKVGIGIGAAIAAVIAIAKHR